MSAPLWYSLTLGQRRAIRLLADGLPHRTHGHTTTARGINATVASKLEKRGLVSYVEGATHPMVVITAKGSAAAKGER